MKQLLLFCTITLVQFGQLQAQAPIPDVYNSNSWTESTQILASDGSMFDNFGCSVSISGDYAIVGSYGNNENGSYSGSAYIFHRSGSIWTEQAKLIASDGYEGDRFGNSVSISGDYAIAGAFGDDENGNNSGSAYIFHRNGSNWTQQAKLTASDGAAHDRFGNSVSISGDYAVVGARLDNDNGGNSGSVYIFHRNDSDWTQQAKLTASDGAAGDNFGSKVSISGNYVIIGAHFNDYNGTDSGSAYIFERSGSSWNEQAKLTASDGAVDDLFGISVSISDDYAIVGAVMNDDNGLDSGSAYIFHRSGSSWNEQSKLTASDGAAYDHYGISVSIDGDYAIVGASGDNVFSNSDAAYIYHRDGSSWTQQAKLTATNGVGGNRFGWSVAINGNSAIVGAHQDNYNGTYSGSAYIFEEGSLSTDDRFDLNSLNLYPNPSSSSITIENPQLMPIDKISIYDLKGRMVYSLDTKGEPSNQTIKISDLEASVYNVVIESDGKQTMKRLVRK